MEQIDTLSTLPSVDPKRLKNLYPDAAKTHPGKMKTVLARELLHKYVPDEQERLRSIVLDPMVGAGTTCVASVLEGFLRFVGCDLVQEWVQCAKEARYNSVRGYQESEPFAPRNMAEGLGCRSVILCGRSEEVDLEPYLKGKNVPILLTSPPFPNAHTQGNSPMQQLLRSTKSTHAGNEFVEQKQWTRQPKFVESLRTVLEPWARYVSKKGVVLVHIKNFIRKNEEVRADLWVADALKAIPGLRVEGYLSAPLGYRSHFQQMRLHPSRKILKYEVSEKSGSIERLDHLECGHTKFRDHDPGDSVKEAKCTTCPQLEGVAEVREERVVVARKLT